MALAPGSRLGPYQVGALIGAGGVGEVYRARDPRLGREVAVKILSASAAASSERLRRFEDEGRALAALNHPNILSVLDVGSENGSPYVVFELLEGVSLGDRLRRGPLPPRKAVEYVVQVCHGLAAAHAKGIVHRDLKPSNLFLTSGGRVKILDFGLAKLSERPTAEGEPEDSRTGSTDSGQGGVLGTVGYMSPEQVRGRPADARSDLFSLGATFYEMLAGRRAFQGETSADTMSAILNHEPPEVTGPAESFPPALGRIVHRCLEKDPEERFQSARDLAFALEALSLGSRSGTQPLEGRFRTRRHWLLGAAGAALLAGGGALGLALSPTLRERPALPRIQQLTFRRGMVDWARFTSDGKTVVYGAYWDGKPPEIFSTRLESRESRSLGLPPARLLAVSSRGELAILLTRPDDLDVNATGTLARVSLSGGEPKRVLDDVYFADWSPDGRELAVQRRVDGVFQLEYPIGNTIIRPLGLGQPFRISPRGDKLAIMPGDEALAVYDRSGRKLATFPTLPPNESFAWDGDDALWVLAGESQTARTIWRVTLDGEAREVYRSVGQLGILHDASPDGRLLVHQGFERLGVRSKLRGEDHERELGVFNWSAVKALSDDGQQLLIYEDSGGPPGFSFIRSADGSPPVRLGEGDPFALSPDGRWALLGSYPVYLPLTLVPTGAGEPRQLVTDGFEGVRFAWFLDDRRVVVAANLKGSPPRSFLFDAAGRAPRPITPEGTFAVPGSYAWGTVIGWSRLDGTFARFPIDGGEPRPLEGRVLLPHWPLRASADGRSVFVNGGGVPKRIERLDLTSGKRTPWKSLLPEEPAGVVLLQRVVLTPDGQGYAYDYGRFLQDLFVIDGLRESASRGR
jgi:hypothetical protein